MAQHDYNLANQSGADFRADLNNALSAIATTNSGATSPSTTFAHQLWVDTANSVLKIRNSANDAWITTGVSITADNTFTGNITGNASTATALETARTINGASFDGTANISFNTDAVSEGSSNLYYTTARFDTAFSGKSTSDLSEGTNLYYTDTRFDTRLATKDTDDLTEGTNLYFTNARVESYLDAGTSTPTFASAVINSSLTGSAVLDDDTFGTASATTVATSESIKAYVDSQVGSVDTLAEILLNGNTTGGTDIEFGDNDKAIFGTGGDLEIYHDGSHSYIRNTVTGNLYIRNLSDDKDIILQSDDGAGGLVNYVQVDGSNGEVRLSHYGSEKFNTTSTGVAITGNATFDDNGKAIFGTGEDLEIYHDGSNSYIKDVGTGTLNLQGATQVLIGSATTGEVGLQFFEDGGVRLRHNNVTKFETTSTGIDVTGTVTSDGLTVDAGNIALDDNRYITWGSNTGRVKISGNESLDDIRFNTDNSERMRLTNTGLGIGTTSPNAKLTVQNGLQRINSTDGSSDARILFSMVDGSNTPSSWIGIPNWNKDGFYIFGPTANGNESAAFYTGANWVFQTGGTERLRIDSSGKLGVNTTSLDGILTLKQLANSDSNGLDGIRIDASTGTTYAGFGLANATGTLAITAGDAGGTENTEIVFKTASSGSESERARIDSSGNLLVGGTFYGQDDSCAIAANGEILVARASGTGRTMIGFRNGGTTVGTITTTSTTTSYNTSSDARLKDVTGEARGLEVITKLNPVAYNWKADGKADEGLIAQEVKEIVPNAVSGSEDEHYQMDYSKLVTPLVKAVQELEQQVTKLKSEIANLKGE